MCILKYLLNPTSVHLLWVAIFWNNYPSPFLQPLAWSMQNKFCSCAVYGNVENFSQIWMFYCRYISYFITSRCISKTYYVRVLKGQEKLSLSLTFCSISVVCQTYSCSFLKLSHCHWYLLLLRLFQNIFFYTIHNSTWKCSW